MVLVRGVALGICGTDREIAAGQYGAAPPGQQRMILGHESLGRVEHAPESSGLRAGDLVVAMVRHPDPVPCPNCAVGEWDMCRNGLYTEHGIKELDGFGAEYWQVAPDRLIRVDASLGELGVLLEPASVVAKAWQHADAIGRRATWEPRVALITGAGPVGLLAALLGVQRGLEVHVYDRVPDGPKPDIVASLGATYHSSGLDELDVEPDIVIECTGASAVVLDVIRRTAANGIVALAGLSSGGRRIDIDMASLNRTLVLENDVVFGSVNANRTHYELAADALARAERTWLSSLITRRLPLHRYADAITRQPDDVKTIIDLTA
ncbi:MAG TPA: glucose 1-dehydrogenase [Longimicrobiales bacterium]|nr:glucose 1-dehydrogenase [Longimicrobiales bacterium]